LSIGDGYLLARAGEHFVSALRVRVYDHLQSLPLEYHHDRRRADVLSLLTWDLAKPATAPGDVAQARSRRSRTITSMPSTTRPAGGSGKPLTTMVSRSISERVPSSWS